MPDLLIPPARVVNRIIDDEMLDVHAVSIPLLGHDKWHSGDGEHDEMDDSVIGYAANMSKHRIHAELFRVEEYAKMLLEYEEYMSNKISRRNFIWSGSTLSIASAISGAALVSACSSAALAQTTQMGAAPGKKPRLTLETVNAFVIAGHFDLDKVQEMLVQEPKLINAAWDWGNGDWETALGGASHTGHKAIARYLIAKGARMDVFAAAMLGEFDIVKAAIEAFPDSKNTLGPHGITLMAHAKAGGEEAVAVLKYLESKAT